MESNSCTFTETITMFSTQRTQINALKQTLMLVKKRNTRVFNILIGNLETLSNKIRMHWCFTAWILYVNIRVQYSSKFALMQCIWCNKCMEKEYNIMNEWSFFNYFLLHIHNQIEICTCSHPISMGNELLLWIEKKKHVQIELQDDFFFRSKLCKYTLSWSWSAKRV